jgi:hypothetical protein
MVEKMKIERKSRVVWSVSEHGSAVCSIQQPNVSNAISSFVLSWKIDIEPFAGNPSFD